MASPPSPQAEALARRYPLLHGVPPERRSGVMRAAILHPLILGPILLFSLILIPPYLNLLAPVLNVEQEANLALKLGKYLLLILPPTVLAIFLLTRFLMPLVLRKVMLKRGFEPAAAPAPARRRPSPAAPPRWKKKQRP